MSEIIVAALYRFARFPEPGVLRPGLAAVCARAGVRGTLLLAPEGINGTIAGSRSGIDTVVAAIRSLPGCGDVTPRESRAPRMPFARMKVRLKQEIVHLGVSGVDPVARPGMMVEPQGWNALIRSPDVAVIDMRNAYETAIGSFVGAIDPGTAAFGDFPDWWRSHREKLAGKRTAMFCTGGIRCEKAASFLIDQGVGEVLQLKGGILNYLEQIPQDVSLWRGACFVFDGRVSVEHGLVPGAHSLCHACGGAVTSEDRDHPAYEAGVSCPACATSYDEARRGRFRERQRQVDIAAARGRAHLGPAAGRA